MSLNPANANVVYLSRENEGVFEIERYETRDDGKSWKVEAITQNSSYDNVRPYIPRDGSKNQEVVLWMENQKYVHYTNFQTSVRYFVYK